ncbi:hypothetical protein PR003_g13419 [Phytophthora rubi]|uniref:Uncharacterized protein n=1 Tax=Phytophthora rubi TaxID=129364 RepID=A0A6A4F299_9STRA|nr:hypothetical protein PR003_g13419 [Phytophthora rubi]
MVGTDVLGARIEKNALARDALLRGVLIKDAAKISTEARDMWVAFELEKTNRTYCCHLGKNCSKMVNLAELVDKDRNTSPTLVVWRKTKDKVNLNGLRQSR